MKLQRDHLHRGSPNACVIGNTDLPSICRHISEMRAYDFGQDTKMRFNAEMITGARVFVANQPSLHRHAWALSVSLETL